MARRGCAARVSQLRQRLRRGNLPVQKFPNDRLAIAVRTGKGIGRDQAAPVRQRIQRRIMRIIECKLLLAHLLPFI